MKVRVDISIFTSDGVAVGHVNGEINCVVEPVVGDTISFTFSPNGTAIPSGHVFGGQIKVTDRVITPSQKEGGLTLMLSDLIVGTYVQARAIIDYFESEFSLCATLYNDVA